MRAPVKPCGRIISSTIRARKAIASRSSHVADEDRAVGFDQAQHQARDQGAAHAAEPAEHDDGERLVADDEADRRIDQIVQQRDQAAGDRGQRRADRRN